MVFFQFDLATLIWVQNLSQTASVFRKTWYFWDLHRINLNNNIYSKYENVKLKKKNVERNFPNIHTIGLNYKKAIKFSRDCPFKDLVYISTRT
jgi:hypothetical protein